MSSLDFSAIDPITTTLFGLCCFLAGVVCRRRRRRATDDTTPALPSISGELDQRLADLARAWAHERNTPGLSDWAHYRLRSFVRSVQLPASRRQP